jgi:hypothetical protein
MHKRVQDMTSEEQALVFAEKVVLDKDDPQCSIELELYCIESSHLLLSWNIKSVMFNVFYILKNRKFNFNSFRGLELLKALKERYLFPKKHGYTEENVSWLPKIIKLATDRDILDVV